MRMGQRSGHKIKVSRTSDEGSFKLILMIPYWDWILDIINQEIIDVDWR